MSVSAHVYPTSREHVTEGYRCWCKPVLMLPCDECEDGRWKCDGGSILLSVEEAEAMDAAVVVVHNDA